MQLETRMVLVTDAIVLAIFLAIPAVITEIVFAMGPRRWNESIIRVVHGERRNKAMSQTPRSKRLASCPIHCPRKDVVLGRVFGNQENLIFRVHSDGLG